MCRRRLDEVRERARSPRGLADRARANAAGWQAPLPPSLSSTKRRIMAFNSNPPAPIILLGSSFHRHNFGSAFDAPERSRSCDRIITRLANWVIAAMRIAAIAQPSAMPRCGVVSLSAIPRWGIFCEQFSRPVATERKKDETDFEDGHRLGCDPVHICVYGDDGTYRSRR